MKVGGASCVLALNLVVALLLAVQPTETLAVGTWGGAEPPSDDDLYTNAPWWVLPMAFVFVIAQAYVFGRWPLQFVSVIAAFLAGATADKWFGSTAGWIVAVIVIFLFYRWFKADESSPPQAAASQENSPASKGQSPQTQATSSVSARAPEQFVSSNKPAEEQSSPKAKEVERLVALRHRMDLEMKENGSMDSRRGK